METFFEGEVERLQFTSDRMSKRALEKKARDAAVLDEKVLLFLFIRRILSMYFILSGSISTFCTRKIRRKE